MVKKFKDFIKENYTDKSDSVIDKKLDELYDLVSNYSDKNILYEFENKNDHEVIINFTFEETPYQYKLDIDKNNVSKTSNNELEFESDINSIEEGFDLIEKDIFKILGISEKKKVGRPKSGRTESGRKVPGKYLTRNKKLMKKEIEEFYNKKDFKVDWDADYKSGKGGKGNRHETKKSDATKEYQKKFGKK